ncbi:hypothetical protein CFP71_27910 [Amycolatopsis thailandensis]|uniref:Uncharacterized protein n=1 Tax=Amycolatopsis thailandensis TaxID=589330 RepID=A0A229RUC3_9PSEU|nr:hypothetical protein [Amycolatopsis thailandensis]OXM50262.1 hypothetical protein CFP71_27910 [Amycolatopsis thailandensis]
MDWPTLQAEHADELEVAGTVGAGGPDWSGVLRAWRILDDPGHAPRLDVDLEIKEVGKPVQLRHSGISTGSGRLPDDDLATAVSGDLRMRCDLDWPSSSLRITYDTDDGAPAPVVPSQARHTDLDTTWSWASLGPDEVPPD